MCRAVEVLFSPFPFYGTTMYRGYVCRQLGMYTCISLGDSCYMLLSRNVGESPESREINLFMVGLMGVADNVTSLVTTGS